MTSGIYTKLAVSKGNWFQGSDFVKIKYFTGDTPIITTSIIQDGYSGGTTINPSKKVTLFANVQSSLAATLKLKWEKVRSYFLS